MASPARRVALIAIAATVIAIASVSTQTAQRSSEIQRDEVVLRIIVVESADDARRVVEQLRQGENFVTLAMKVSSDPTARNGGLLGRVSLSTLRPELRDALRDVGVGQLSAVVPIPTGFAVLKVVPDDEADGRTVAPNRGVTAAGSVRYVTDLSGFSEASLVLRLFEKPDDWNRDPQAICRARQMSLAETQRSLETDLSSDAFLHATGQFDVAQAHIALGQMHAYPGRMSQSIELLGHALVVVAAHVPSVRMQTQEALGIAHLHKAELDNGLYHQPGDRCLLLAPHRHSTRTADFERAIEYFSTYLDEKPADLEVRWLLNVAHMLAGTYPDGVPSTYLISPSAFASGEDIGRFVDVASQTGLISIASAGGVIVDDFDNDGQFEVVTSSFDSCQPMHFFRRAAHGRFTEQGAAAGLAGQLGGLNVMQTDYNNDGLLDILLLRGGWELPQRKSLLRNNGDATFTDVTVESGLATPTSTQTAVWADIDNDGFVDLFVGNEEQPAQLFLNKRDGTFVDIASSAGVNQPAYSKGVSSGDYDNDGWPDLYVSNLGGRNFLYHNNHDRTFTEIGAAAGVPGPGQGFATWFFDYDNDGRQDIFATSYFTSVDETARTYLRMPNNAQSLKLYRNLGDGSFQDVTRQVGLEKVFMPMGANFGDVDNDGFLDIYLGTGNPSYGSLVPSVLLHNRDGKLFTDVTTSSGTGELHKGHGVAFADLDNDGDQEIVFEVGGATPGDAHPLRLFANPGHGNDWIALKLVGVKSNRAAIGARIAVTVERDGQRHIFHRTVGSGGSFGASPLQQHVGLGKSARIVAVDVSWPTSQTRQHFSSVEKNQVIQITEFAETFRQLPRTTLSPGGKRP